MSSYLGKFPFRKEAGQQFPCGISLSVFLPTLKKALWKMLAIAQGFATFLKGGNIVSFNFTDVYD